MGDVEELAAEQRHVDRAYERLLVRQSSADAMEIGGGESAGEILERDELAAIRARRVEALRIGDLPLCFGRVDTAAAETWHIGRLGVADEHGDPLVVDWRAPVAAPFYRATPRTPLGIIRRRHLRCSAATVLGIDDEEFAGRRDDDGLVLVGEAALLRAMQQRRTGRMGDIVATIQAEQDHIIRAPLSEPIVVQGGPGTGKTAVALHRLAYLLYTHREVLEVKGVLILGPSSTFLRYIERVLPSLGEQGATLATIGSLYGGAHVPNGDREASSLKGDLRMAELIRRAVHARQRPLRKAMIIPMGAYRLRFGPRASSAIVERARSLPGPHNERRKAVERSVFAHLHALYLAAVDRARRAGLKVAPPMSTDEFRSHAGSSREARLLLDRLWPVLTPERLLADLFDHPALLREAAVDLLDEEEQRVLLRPGAGSGAEDRPDRVWSDDDIALLDEAAVHLGAVPSTKTPRRAAEDLDWMADRVLDGVAADANISMSASMAAEIRERIVREEVAVPVAPRPRRVTSSYAHVVVDEAQDLSPMQWRMVARRCPSGSVTLVGDLGQASRNWRLGWEAVLEQAAPSASGHILELTMNYRTPREVMELAARVLRAANPSLEPPSSVRSTGRPPVLHEVDDSSVGATAVTVARPAGGEEAGGTSAIIAMSGRHPELRTTLDDDPATRSRGHDPLDDPVALLSPDQAKGLEFDRVVVVEPEEIAATAAGLLALYVALTRTTDELIVVHARPLPECMVS